MWASFLNEQKVLWELKIILLYLNAIPNLSGNFLFWDICQYNLLFSSLTCKKKVELILERKALRSVFFFDKCIAISRSIWICGKTANLEEFRRSKTCRSWSGDCQHVTFVKTDHLRALLCDWDKVKPSKSFQLKCKEQNSGEWRQRSIKSSFKKSLFYFLQMALSPWLFS